MSVDAILTEGYKLLSETATPDPGGASRTDTDTETLIHIGFLTILAILGGILVFQISRRA